MDYSVTAETGVGTSPQCSGGKSGRRPAPQPDTESGGSVPPLPSVGDFRTRFRDAESAASNSNKDSEDHKEDNPKSLKPNQKDDGGTNEFVDTHITKVRLHVIIRS